MNQKLPDRPNLEHLKNQAKSFLSSWKAQNADALDRVRTCGFEGGEPALNRAQLVIAREYGFASWSQLKSHVESISLSREESARKLVSIALIDSMAPSRERTIRNLLSAHPDLDSFDLGLACMFGNVAFVDAALQRNPEAVNQKTGFAEREPLLYATFSWFLKNDQERKVRIRDVVRLLLEKGADPNAGYPHEKDKLSALYGAAGVANDPETVKLLIDKGADVNDGESLYHSVEHPGTKVLEHLFTSSVNEESKSHALFRKLDFDDLEAARWLLDHGVDPNIRWRPDGSVPLIHALKRQQKLPVFELLLERGADPNLANNLGTRPFTLAQRLGRKDVADLLLRYGARAEVDAFDAWVMAVLAGKADGLSQPDFRSLNRDQADILCVMAGEANISAVEALLNAGMPVDLGVHGTPLHWACWHGKLQTVRFLVQRGAPLEAKDHMYNGTALGWTMHGSVNCRQARPEDYVAIFEALANAGAILPGADEGWWQDEGSASPEIQAWLLARVP